MINKFIAYKGVTYIIGLTVPAKSLFLVSLLLQTFLFLQKYLLDP